MNPARLLARVVAIGMIGGGASALFSQTAHADDTVVGPLAGSDTAIILGGTFESTPDKAFAQSAENLYLHPLGFDDGATYSTVCDMVGTDPCAAPLQVLTTPELIQQGPSSLTAADDVTLAVENEFNANPDAFSAAGPADDLRLLAERHRRVDRHDPDQRLQHGPRGQHPARRPALRLHR